MVFSSAYLLMWKFQRSCVFSETNFKLLVEPFQAMLHNLWIIHFKQDILRGILLVLLLKHVLHKMWSDIDHNMNDKHHQRERERLMSLALTT